MISHSNAGNTVLRNGIAISVPLYIILTGAFIFLWITAAGGGVWGQHSYWGLQWQHLMFEGMCHQIPGRSFWIGDQPMAVCARCFGVYTSLLLGMVVLPWIPKTERISQLFLLIGLIIILGVNGLDVLASIAGFWENSSIIRFTFGMGLGSIGILYLINKS